MAVRAQQATVLLGSDEVLAGGPVKGRSEWARAISRFRRYRPGMVGLGFICVLVILAVFAPADRAARPKPHPAQHAGCITII